MIYDDAIIIKFDDGTEALFSPHPNPDPTSPTLPYEVKDGDTLFSIATEYYGDTREWYTIAEFNFPIIEDIFNLTPGTVIYLPR